MSDMIERVERAICGCNCVRQKIGLGPCINKDRTNGPCQANDAQLLLGGPRTAAKAAMEALREPTDAMLARLVLEGKWQDPDPGKNCQYMDPADAWRGLIGAVLKDGE